MTAELIVYKPVQVDKKKIKVNQLKKLGYKLGDKQIPLGKKPYRYGILEVFNEDNKKEVGFCYLFLTREMAGVILPQPFHFYKLHQIKNLRTFLTEQGINE